MHQRGNNILYESYKSKVTAQAIIKIHEAPIDYLQVDVESQ